MQNEHLIEARLVLLGAVHVLKTDAQEIEELLRDHKRAAVTYATIRTAILHSLSCIEDAMLKQKP